MKKRYRSLIHLSLALIMMLSVTGCSNNEQESTKTPDTGGEATVDTDDEIVTLKMFVRNQSKYTGLQEDPVSQYVEDKLGVRIDLTVDSSLGNTTAQTSTYNELLAAKLASNDLDDIMDFGSPGGNSEVLSNLNRAVEAGMIIPLDDLVESYASNLSTDSRLLVRNEYRKEHMYEDGNFYSVGGWGGMGLDQLPGSANWIRWDLYKEKGYPDIKTDQEYLGLLKELMEENEETPKGEKIYGLGGAFADPQGMGDGFVNRDYPLSKGYESIEGNYAVYLNHGTQSVEAPLLDSDSFFWNGVKFYFDANQMGILDPGSMTMGSSEYEEKIDKGVYLGTLNGWGVMNKEEIMENLGMEDSGYMPMNLLDDVASFTLYWESVIGGNEFVITKNCEHPEKAIAFLDWCMSEEGSRMITQGAEGLAWEMDGDEPKVMEQYTKDNMGGQVDMVETYGKWKYAGINAFQHIDLDSNGYYIQPEYMQDPDTYSPVKKDALEFYGADSFNEYFSEYTGRDGEKVPNIVWSTYMSGIGSKPDDIKQKYGQINDYMYKAVFKLIYAADEAEYETLKTETIAAVEGLGVEEVVEWYINRFDEMHGSLDDMINDAVKAYGVDLKQ